jgi:hypothetical protein
MAATVFLHSAQSSPALEARGGLGLRADLETWLGSRGRVTQHIIQSGTSWEINFVAPRKAAVDGYLPDLLAFLRDWGVPKDAYLRICTRNNRGVVERWVEVWSAAARVVHRRYS